MELDPVDRITTDAIGEPGHRTFYIQARKGGDLVTVSLEKQQVELLSASILEILTRVGLETGEGPGEDEMELEPPLDPRWRAGRLSIGYEQNRDLILLELEELVAGEEDVVEVGEGEPPVEGGLPAESEPRAEGERLRLWATREQMFALSRHGAAVAERGRPSCQFCGNPMDPEGHTCPAMNGHRG